MGIRAPRERRARAENGIRKAFFPFPFSLFLVLFCLCGCASPGQPVARTAPVPVPVTDLSAKQSGNSSVLTFTLPRETVQRRLLKHTPDIEIYRAFSSASTAAATAAAGSSAAAAAGTPAAPPEAAPNSSLLVTIPSALVPRYERDGQIRYEDPWTHEVLEQHSGETALYVVRTSETRKKQSADSDAAGLVVNAVPEPVSDLQAKLAPSTITLTWTAPQRTPIGPAPPIKEYDIYRAEISLGSSSRPFPASQPQVFPVGGAQRGKTPPQKIGSTTSPSYQDSEVSLGVTYRYFVRSAVEYSGGAYESADSNLATITMRDIFPPAAPAGLVVVPVPAEGGKPAHLDLSWNLNPETDVVGYNVYRSEQQGTPGARLNSELLPTPAFSDMSTVAGERYFYRVTAVDRSGNESEPSAAVSREVPAESQPKP